MVAALSIGEFQISNLIAGFRYRNYPIVLPQAFYGARMACAATVAARPRRARDARVHQHHATPEVNQP
jgi:hypothetical protein